VSREKTATPVPPRTATAAPHLVVAAPRPYEVPELREAMGDTLRPGGLRLTGRALETCGFASGARLLDVGCGLGATAAFLTRKGYRITGVEPSALLLEEARRRCPGVDLLPGSAEALPFADATFDGVFMECVLSLVGQRAAALSEVARVLRPGGRLVVSDVYARDHGLVPTPPAHIEAEFRSHGYELESWEDHTDALIQLVAKMVFAGISTDSLTRLLGCEACAPSSPAGATGRAGRHPADVGYYLATVHPAGAAEESSPAHAAAENGSQGRRHGRP
jgi:arsenite methyltransferase